MITTTLPMDGHTPARPRSTSPSKSTALSFALSMLVCTIVFTLLWSMLLPGKIYACSDAAGLDYLSPGSWVHGHYENVETMSTNRDMSAPDQLLVGWTPRMLWYVWMSFFVSSLLLSYFLATRATHLDETNPHHPG